MSSAGLPLIAAIGTVTLLSALAVAAGSARFAGLERRTRWTASAVIVAVHSVLLVTTPASLAASNGIVLATAIGVGTLIGASIRERNALVALAIAASVADIISFSFGPTRWLFEHGAGAGWGALNYLTISMPWGPRIIPLVGVGDLLFVGAFSLALRRLGAPAAAAAVAPIAGLLVALAVGIAIGGAWGIPFMAATTVAYAVRYLPRTH